MCYHSSCLSCVFCFSYAWIISTFCATVRSEYALHIRSDRQPVHMVVLACASAQRRPNAFLP